MTPITKRFLIAGGAVVLIVSAVSSSVNLYLRQEKGQQQSHTTVEFKDNGLPKITVEQGEKKKKGPEDKSRYGAELNIGIDMDDFKPYMQPCAKARIGDLPIQGKGCVGLDGDGLENFSIGVEIEF